MPNRPSTLRTCTVAFFLLALPMAAACSGGNAASQLAKPPVFEPPGTTKCGVVKSQAEPLIVEWPDAERGRLESLIRRQVVAVKYIGCDMQVLAECKLPGGGAYGYAAITRKKSHVRMANADELYANIPVHAAQFEGRLASSGELNVDMTIVGRYETDKPNLAGRELPAECAGATHVVTALSVGAFEFFAGADATVGGGAAVGPAKAGGSSSARRETLNEDGVKADCEKATVKDKEPPGACGALLRVEVVPLGEAKRAEPVCPGGTKWDGAQCVRTVVVDKIICPPGTQLQGTSCMGNVVPGTSPASGGAPAPARAPGAGVALDGMVSLPGGTFTMGDRGDTVKVSPFSLDVTEVTVDAYKRCATCSAPDTGGYCNWGVSGRGSHPVNCVDWNQATAFCAAVGKRLPTEEEWEWAARGTTRGTTYPWGNGAPGRQLCWDGEGSDLGKGNRHGTCPVGSYPGGDSPEGIKDLAGNVWEWTASNSATARVLRGGGWSSDIPAGVRAAIRVDNDPGDRNGGLGFRCAR
jgi:formylglycine-generating enzyme required for sulfatase activity